MSRRFLLVLLLLGGGVWFFAKNFRLEGLEHLRVHRRTPTETVHLDDVLPVTRQGEVIRVGSFNAQVLGRSKSEKVVVMEILARIVRQFDVLALQEISAEDQDVLARLIERVNSDGRRYDYVVGRPLGKSAPREQYAFLFDRESVEIDRDQLYTVEDPQQLLYRPPLVGSFRVRGPAREQAFTFTLVNLRMDSGRAVTERTFLDDVFRLVRDDGRGEDDVILLGDFQADDEHLGPISEIAGMAIAVTKTPTNPDQTKQWDNLVFESQATEEFTGRSGTLNLMRQYNLSLQEAREVCDHLPGWAVLSIYEGGIVPEAKPPAEEAQARRQGAPAR
ncbi:MAG: endonuclease/exonuclease/phosphatase family protein [Planctomycetota bacterium]|nr:endonuclease/exonuclease/phosphatase family protein [Planctomycetota bacterium]